MSSSASDYDTEFLDRDSSSESEEKAKRKTAADVDHTADTVTNLCKNYTCMACGTGCMTQASIKKHLLACKLHQKKKSELTCSWCKLKFCNRGALTTHARLLHGDSSYKAYQTSAAYKNEFECCICKRNFDSNWKLKFHIRGIHFNLIGRAPYAELKKVNQVWFEKVMNSSNIIEIKKTGHNVLVMKKIDENTVIKLQNDNERIIDVSHVYPTNRGRNVKVKCQYCNKMLIKKDHNKHVQEIHFNIKKNHCNNCNRSFKRFYQFIKHVCNKVTKVKGVKRGNSDIIISSVNSLSAVPFLNKEKGNY